jgi:ornithine cyclodeaminase
LIYLNENHLEQLGTNWHETVQTVEEALLVLHKKDFTQPIKPYLRYGNLKNRIIAMPAFLGGDFQIAGIKWIASFPENIKKGLPRAHSVIVLNNAETGVPCMIINTPKASIVRTASVSGVLIKKYIAAKAIKKLKVGIVGWGPIGKAHYEMCKSLLRDFEVHYTIYDKQESALNTRISNGISIGDSWQKAYRDADIFITCTVADKSYIDIPPKEGSLHLNVSLRDYTPGTYHFFKNNIIVDDWDEVCRERTDIEVMHMEMGLQKEGTRNMADVVVQNSLLVDEAPETPIFFNPMGMGIFDLAIAEHYFRKAGDLNIGVKL